MTRQSVTKAYANFSEGLVTEANKLAYPENAAIDMDNMDLNEDGSVQRRAGLRFDGVVVNPLAVTSNPLANTATTVHKWKAVNGDPSINIAVIQTASQLDFYYIRDDEMLATKAADPITLVPAESSDVATTLLVEQTPISVASGGGRLYVVGKYIDPIVLEFTDPREMEPPLEKWDEGKVEETSLTLKIRDFEIAGEGEFFEDVSIEIAEPGAYGLPYGTGEFEEKTYSLAGEIKQGYCFGAQFYNLANQGWPSKIGYTNPLTDEFIDDGILREDDAYLSTGTTGGSPFKGKPAKETFEIEAIGFYPTTQDLYHSYQYGGGTSVTQQTAYNPYLIDNNYTGTTPSPRGRLIKDAFNIVRKAQGIQPKTHIFPEDPMRDNGFLDETIKAATRPTTVAFYAGRVWYAGLEGKRFTNNLYFTQIIGDTLQKAEKCYQEADPTAEEIHDLIATDGGVIGLEEVGKILGIAPIGPSLVVIADNGVWAISGDGDFTSFKADTFTVRKITDQGASSIGSISFAKDVIYYWGDTSIVGVLTGPQGGISAQDISSTKIKELYQQIAGVSKETSFSIFDEGSNKIFWFYADDLDPAFDNFHGKAFNKVLYWDISLGAFGKYSLAIQPNTLIVDAISANLLNLLTIEDPITDGGVQVTVDTDPLVSTTESFVSERSSIKLLTIVGNALDGFDYRFSDFSDIVTFTDWDNAYSSFIESGFDSLGDILGKAKKAPLIQIHFERTEDGFTFDSELEEYSLDNQSSCLASYGWDWEESPYSNQFQAYKLLRVYNPLSSEDTFDYDQTIISTRNRIRGRGISLGLRFESEAGKDFRLLGYGILYNTRGRP